MDRFKTQALHIVTGMWRGIKTGYKCEDIVCYICILYWTEYLCLMFEYNMRMLYSNMCMKDIWIQYWGVCVQIFGYSVSCFNIWGL